MKLSFIIRLLCGIALLLLAGCSSVTELKNDISDRIFGHEEINPPAALTPIKAQYDSKVAWSSAIGETDRFDFTPALDAGFVYHANAKGELVKIDVTNGRQLWRVNAGESS